LDFVTVPVFGRKTTAPRQSPTRRAPRVSGARVAANGAPRRAQSRLPWQVPFGEHPVGLFADGPR